MRALPTPSRIVLEARLRGESMAEIAAANGLQRGAVRVRARRGYKALRDTGLALAS